ncbi:transporter substrate-binding domain-containing protein [Mesorhizobium sp. ANAO-SY3R2]|uniref:transporter substrate-binding domain-containing protein n=1 Tax=Mesorhizobium sp. ANAO-SY3R2 TaxID=3166644 RepID=UPI00366F5559
MDAEDWQTLVKKLAPCGRLRFALNHGNVVLVQRSYDGQAKGITVDLANELCRHLGVEPEFRHYERAGDVSSSAAADEWDICFLAVDPLRAKTITFTEPYVAIEGCFLVRDGCEAGAAVDVDRLGLKIGVTKASAYSLFLKREAKGAAIVEFPTAEETFEALDTGKVDGLAGVRKAMEQFRDRRSGLRVIQEPFMSIGQAMGLPAGRPEAADFLLRYVTEIKANGFVSTVLERSGEADLIVP